MGVNRKMKGRNQAIEEYYKDAENVWREEFKPIIEWVRPNSNVLDVGCGEGSLGKELIRKGCTVYGVDVGEKAVSRAKAKGLFAKLCDLDSGLEFDNSIFDHVILCDVLEHVYRPKFVLEEALRVGKSIIVASPNLAFFTARLELLFRGRFPKTPLFGYKWYNTEHIHLFSYRDFLELVNELGGKIMKRSFFASSKISRFLVNTFPNMFSVVFCVEVKR